jgi:hypothetical protein
MLAIEQQTVGRTLARRRQNTQLTLPVGAAKLLVTDGFVVKASQFFAIREDLVNRIGDRICVFAATEEILVRKPHGLMVCRAL